MIDSQTALDTRLAGLTQLSRHALSEQFQTHYGKAPPLRLSNATLALAVAHRLQMQAYGGLKPAVRQKLLVGADVAHRRASPGTLLIREWHGLQHTVIVFADHVEYAGEHFRSLTEVTLRITGQKRSGPAFFGLRSSANG